MTEPESLQSRIEKAEAARQAALSRAEDKASPYTSVSSAGLGMRLASEFVAATAVGLGLGIALDRWLGTSPLFLLVLFGLGLAAGILGGIRAYRNFNADLQAQAKAQEAGQDPNPSLPKPDDDAKKS